MGNSLEIKQPELALSDQVSAGTAAGFDRGAVRETIGSAFAGLPTGNR